MNGASIRTQTDKEKRDRLSYRNTEGYADPTCFYALHNVMQQEKKQHRSRDQPNKKNYKTMVIRYD